ncbi:MAG: phosphogluconate dehydrogenase C-terminal domain-containing protein [Paraglaciecola sp.]|uniref:phosphogluconate dehydrogenase C-terminal domain-containing protein n=1 Tax=Paraglaciecola sp. TaxID=1920173 RepID=UPI0032970004
MKKVTLFGAGGKMGIRLGKNLANSDFAVCHVEVAPEGIARLKAEVGADPVDPDQAIIGADVVILAIPDTVIGKVAQSLVPKLSPGTMLMVLDGAAPYAGHLPERADISYFISHPCHPPIFNNETTEAGRNDHFGGIAAKQSVVNALMQGPESHYELGDKVARAMYAPVSRTHRCTVEQMAFLEPGLSETVCASLLVVMRQAMDEVVKKGVSEECARDFLLGHMNILSAVIFEEIEGVFSDACNKAIEYGIPTLMKDDWKKVFDPDRVLQSVHRIT